MGLVIVFLRAPFGGYDGLPDPVGWILVLLGIVALRRVLPEPGLLLFFALTAGVISAGIYWPPVSGVLAPNAEWALSLPQLAFCIMICHVLAGLTEENTAGRFRLLRWAFVVLAVAPAVLYGGQVDALAVPIAVGATVADIYLVYLLFKISRKVVPATDLDR
jgi:hypothetical protein